MIPKRQSKHTSHVEMIWLLQHSLKTSEPLSVLFLFNIFRRKSNTSAIIQHAFRSICTTSAVVPVLFLMTEKRAGKTGVREEIAMSSASLVWFIQFHEVSWTVCRILGRTWQRGNTRNWEASVPEIPVVRSPDCGANAVFHRAEVWNMKVWCS